MNRLIIDIDSLKYNLGVINKWMDRQGSSWTVVTKVLCGHSDTLKALQMLGIKSIGDTRLSNIRAIEKIDDSFETWYLRVTDLSSIKDIVSLCNVSLNSEMAVIKAINDEAKIQNRLHKVIIMIELGDLREGILPGSLVNFYEDVFRLSNIEVLGIGANIGCMAGAVPSVDQFMQLVLYKELLELKFKRKLSMISAGSSVVLPMVLSGQLPKPINHFRIGEAIFLGTDLVNSETLPYLSNEVVLLEAEIVEIKKKGLTPLVETGAQTPFSNDFSEEVSPGQRGYRALVNIGQLDTDISGLTPMNPDYNVTGASSDITVVNVGEDTSGLKVGDSIKFRLNYSALLRLMSSKYIKKELKPSLNKLANLDRKERFEVVPVIDQDDLNKKGRQLDNPTK
ncbi:MAG: alanine racemase [candidate division Zixibacteria bacterium]|nr:alanine racemase [candidate division Zixibacteria bacterium]